MSNIISPRASLHLSPIQPRDGPPVPDERQIQSPIPAQDESSMEVYARTKSAAQILLSSALIADDIRALCDVSKDAQPYFYAYVVFLSLSLALDVTVVVMATVLFSLKLSKPPDHVTARLNVGVTIATLLVAAVHGITQSFSTRQGATEL